MKKMMVAVLVLTTSHLPISWAVDSFWEDTAGAASKKSNAGIELIRTGDLEGARRLFKQAVALDPENAGFWANLGMVQVDLGEEVAALKSFRRGLGVDPNNKLILKNIKELESSSTSSAAVGASGNVEIIDLSNKDNAGVDLVTSLTDDAIDVAETGDLQQALELFQKACDAGPDNGRTWENLGVTHLRLGNLKEAREALEEAQRLLPDDEQSVLQNMAALAEHEEFYRNNKAGSAKGSMAAKAANSEVNGDLALAARLTEEAISLAEANKMQDAFGLFEQAALASPLDSKLWENLGVTEMRMGQLANSQANFQKAKDLFVGVFEGSSLEKNIAALQTHLDFAAKNQATASDEYWSEEDDEDYEDEEDAASLEEKLQALTDEAILKADADDLLGALLLFQKAAHLSPRSFKQHENVGVTQMRLGLLDAARASLEKASELLGGATSASLLDNFKALSEHEAYAKSIGHNPAMVYAEFSKGNDGQGLAGVEDEYDEDADDEYRDDAYAAEVDPLRAEELTEEAITAAEGGNFENALELFQEAADANPTEGRMWENLGVTQMRANYLDDALVSFKRARKLSPKLDNRNLEALQEHLDHRASVQAAREQAMNPNYARIGKFSSEAQSEEEVEDAEKSALGAESESKEVTIVLNQPLGISLWPGLLIERVATGGQLETTAAAGDRVLSVASTHVWSFDQLKMELEAMRNAGLPSAVLTVAHSLKKTNATPSRTSSSGGSPEEEESALVKEAVDYLSTGNLESALSSFQAALELSPQKGELWANVGNVQRDLGLTDEALKSYERGLVLDPDSSLLSTNLNELRASQGAARSGGVSLSEQERSEGAGFCDDGFNTELVHVGDKVEVRDSGGSWALGVVEGVNPSTNQPSVTKDGFDADYEWDECRLPR